jgi:hypothetical protein
VDVEIHAAKKAALASRNDVIAVGTARDIPNLQAASTRFTIQVAGK